MDTPKVGDRFLVDHPFIREEISGLSDVEISWRPGIRLQDTGTGDAIAFADGIGKQVLTVVDVHKPGKFVTRVFFTRSWADPDGKTFGKGSLRIKAMSAFRILLNGYRHEFTLSPAPSAKGGE